MANTTMRLRLFLEPVIDLVGAVVRQVVHDDVPSHKRPDHRGKRMKRSRCAIGVIVERVAGADTTGPSWAT